MQVAAVASDLFSLPEAFAPAASDQESAGFADVLAEEDRDLSTFASLSGVADELMRVRQSDARPLQSSGRARQQAAVREEGTEAALKAIDPATTGWSSAGEITDSPQTDPAKSVLSAGPQPTGWTNAGQLLSAIAALIGPALTRTNNGGAQSPRSNHAGAGMEQRDPATTGWAVDRPTEGLDHTRGLPSPTDPAIVEWNPDRSVAALNRIWPAQSDPETNAWTVDGVGANLQTDPATVLWMVPDHAGQPGLQPDSPPVPLTAAPQSVAIDNAGHSQSDLATSPWTALNHAARPLSEPATNPSTVEQGRPASESGPASDLSTALNHAARPLSEPPTNSSTVEEGRPTSESDPATNPWTAPNPAGQPRPQREMSAVPLTAAPQAPAPDHAGRLQTETAGNAWVTGAVETEPATIASNAWPLATDWNEAGHRRSHSDSGAFPLAAAPRSEIVNHAGRPQTDATMNVWVNAAVDSEGATVASNDGPRPGNWNDAAQARPQTAPNSAQQSAHSVPESNPATMRWTPEPMVAAPGDAEPTALNPADAARTTAHPGEPSRGIERFVAPTPDDAPAEQPLSRHVAFSGSIEPRATPQPFAVPAINAAITPQPAETVHRMTMPDESPEMPQTPLRTLTVTVEPAGADRTDIHFTHRNGAIDMVVRSASPETARALRNDLPELVRSLEDRGYRSELDDSDRDREGRRRHQYERTDDDD